MGKAGQTIISVTMGKECFSSRAALGIVCVKDAIILIYMTARLLYFNWCMTGLSPSYSAAK